MFLMKTAGIQDEIRMAGGLINGAAQMHWSPFHIRQPDLPSKQHRQVNGIPISLMKKQRLREIQGFAQGHSHSALGLEFEHRNDPKPGAIL